MAERRGCISDPGFKKLFELANDLAIAKNPQRWFNLSAVRVDEFGEKQPIMDASEVERLEVVEEIEKQLKEALEGVGILSREEEARLVSIFGGFVEQMESDELLVYEGFVQGLDLDGFSAEEAEKQD